MDTSLTDLGVCFCVKGDILACNFSKIYHDITVAVVATIITIRLYYVVSRLDRLTKLTKTRGIARPEEARRPGHGHGATKAKAPRQRGTERFRWHRQPARGNGNEVVHCVRSAVVRFRESRIEGVSASGERLVVCRTFIFQMATPNCPTLLTPPR